MFPTSLSSSRRVLRWGLAPATLALLTLTGCGGGLFKRNQVPDYSNLGGATTLDSYDKLTDQQVADLKFAAARTHESSGALEEALQTYQEVLKLDAKRADVPLRIAIVYDKLARFDKSPEYYQKALQLQPGNPDVYCDIGYSQYLQQRFPEAEMNLQQAIKLKPDHARAHNNLGMVLAHTGRIGDSLQSFQRGGAKPQDAHTNVAFTLATHGQFEEARKHYKLALAHDPEFTKAQEGLSEITRLQEKADRIRQVAQEFGTLEQEPLASYGAANPRARTAVIGPQAAVAQAGALPTQPTQPRVAAQPKAVPVTAEVPVERKQATSEPAPWARQRMARAADEETPPKTPAAAPQLAKAPEAVKPAVVEKPAAAKPMKAPKLSFSKGALHRDRYLEEQTDPALQQAGFSTASE